MNSLMNSFRTGCSRNLMMPIIVAANVLLIAATAGALRSERSGTLAMRCATHQTKLTRMGAAPFSLIEAGRPAKKAEEMETTLGFETVSYPSARRDLKAWVAKPAGRGPFPAVLFAHQGFRLESKYLADASLLVEAGYLVFIPTWRGENGNPGAFELCRGEAEDAVAALQFCKTLPGVIRTRVYVLGLGTGGTIAMLANELKADGKAFVCVGANPNMSNWQHSLTLPFDPSDPNEMAIRSPALFVADITAPMTLFYGDDDGSFIIQAKQMELKAKKMGRPLDVVILPGVKHGQAFAQAFKQILKRFQNSR